ncbi:MAG: hypothetical protein ABIY55_22100 [Kofleriaceae bacterium]
MKLARVMVIATVLASSLWGVGEASANARVAGFLPSKNGLHFPNAWTQMPDYTLQFFGLSVPIGDASRGLCGGMVLTVKDFFAAGYHIPLDTVNPTTGTPLFTYIFWRLIDSFELPLGAWRYYLLQSPLTSESAQRDTMVTEWQLIKNDLDHNTLSPMALIHVHNNGDPNALGNNHQVLAYGYDQTGNIATIWIYDPNHPDHDDQWISLDVTTGLNVNSSDGSPIYSFFHIGAPPHTPVPTATWSWSNGFEGLDASSWWITGNGGIDVARGLSRTGGNEGWVLNSTGWNAVNTSIPTLPGATCTISSWLRTSGPLWGYMSVHSWSGAMPILNEVAIPVGDGQYHQVSFDFRADGWDALFDVGLWGNGSKAWILLDDASVVCNSWN